MSGARIELRLATGEIVTGRVHGNGGEIGASVLHCTTARQIEHAEKRIEAMIRLANAGRAHGGYEPRSGHARMYIGEFKATQDGETMRDVDLRGARLLSARPSTYTEEQS